jgi:hypothetical protein
MAKLENPTVTRLASEASFGNAPPNFTSWPVFPRIVSGGGAATEEEGGPIFGSTGSSGGPSAAGGVHLPEPEPDDPDPIDDPKSPNPKKTKPTDASKSAAKGAWSHVQQCGSIATEIKRVENRIHFVASPTERAHLEDKLTHLRNWYSQLGC